MTEIEKLRAELEDIKARYAKMMKVDQEMMQYPKRELQKNIKVRLKTVYKDMNTLKGEKTLTLDHAQYMMWMLDEVFRVLKVQGIDFSEYNEVE